jgi:hypothetical protein
LDLGNDGPWWVGGKRSSRTLVPGTICADHIRLAISGVTGQVTLVARTVTLTGDNTVLTPYAGRLVALAKGSTREAVYVSGSGSRFSGGIQASAGGVWLAGSGNQVSSGGVAAAAVKVTGSAWAITG